MKSYFEIYLQKQFTIIVENLAVSQQSFDFDAIHDLRVAIKKVKALFLIVDEISDKKLKVKKRLRKLRKLFKTFGKLRDIQIQKELLSEYEQTLNKGFPELQEYINNIETEYRPVCLQKSLKFKHKNIHKLTKVILRCESFDSVIIKDKITERFRSLQLLSNNVSDSANLHVFRIKLKEIIHILQIISQNKDFISELSVNSTKLKSVAEHLGKWHDKEVFLELLNNFVLSIKPINNEKYINFITKIQKDIEEDLKVLENELINF